MLKLPKDVVADARHDRLVMLLTRDAGPLWEQGRNRVSAVTMTDALCGALRAALSARRACVGLEPIAKRLEAEQRGLDAARVNAPTQPRISRVLFLAADGSTRFYRDCDALLSRYPQRLLACRVEVGGEELGRRISGGKLVRSVLVFDKTLCAQALLALLPPG